MVDVGRRADLLHGGRLGLTRGSYDRQPRDGGGITVTTLRRICAGSMAALDALDRAVQRPRYLNTSRADLNNIKDRAGYPAGTSSTQALRRLRKDRPDLHAEVLAGNTSAHAAMVTTFPWPE